MRRAWTCILTATGLTAQMMTVVSPNAFSNVEAPRWNFAPCATATSRYLQIHSDLGSAPLILRKLALRRDGSITTGIAPFQLTVEMYMGAARPFDAPSWVFADNFVGGRTQVITRKTVTLQSPPSAAAPAPFDIAFALDVPFVYLGGATSLAWQLDLPANIGSSTVGAMDAFVPPVNVSIGTTTGPGCFPSGLSSYIMEHVIGVCDTGGKLAIGGLVRSAQPYAPVVLSLGLSDPNLSVMGLCSPLHTDLALVVPLGVADWSGFVGASVSGPLWGGAFGFAFPNALPGGQLYSQTHSLDLGRTDAVKVANSDGQVITLPQVSVGNLYPVTRLWSDYTLSPYAMFLVGSNIGYGLVTEFTY